MAALVAAVAVHWVVSAPIRTAHRFHRLLVQGRFSEAEAMLDERVEFSSVGIGSLRLKTPDQQTAVLWNFRGARLRISDFEGDSSPKPFAFTLESSDGSWVWLDDKEVLFVVEDGIIKPYIMKLLDPAIPIEPR